MAKKNGQITRREYQKRKKRSFWHFGSKKENSRIIVASDEPNGEQEPLKFDFGNRLEVTETSGQQDKKEQTSVKVALLKKRLNIGILITSGLIIIMILVLFLLK